jgi:phosphatidylserine decarboxylase
VSFHPILTLLKRLPQGAISRGSGHVADLSLPAPLQGMLNRTFARLVGVNVAEAEHPPEAYPSLDAFFTRNLQPGVRTFPADPAQAASPVDGIVGAFGSLESGRLLQAKGLDYSASALLSDATEGARMEGGSFVTIYLSPRHYHRIHTPLAGRIRRAVAIPGRLLPVNLAAVRSVPELFPTNERLVVHLEPRAEAPFGPVALVAVGAFNVGRITTDFDTTWVTNRPKRERPSAEVRDYDLAVEIGAKLAAFHLGSTVVLLFGPHANGSPLPPFAQGIVTGAPISLGDPLFASGEEG